MKISPTRYSGLPTCCASSTLLLGHLGIGDLHLIAKLLAQHLGPAELRAHLIDQGPLADATRVELLSQRTCRQAVARLDIVDRVGDRLVGITIWRRCTSCMRSFSSMSWRVICCFSRSSTSGVIGRPVDSANSLVRLSTSELLITSPFTTATIRVACAAGAGGADTANAATGCANNSPSANHVDVAWAMTSVS